MVAPGALFASGKTERSFGLERTHARHLYARCSGVSLTLVQTSTVLEDPSRFLAVLIAHSKDPKCEVGAGVGFVSIRFLTCVCHVRFPLLNFPFYWKSWVRSKLGLAFLSYFRISA